jgi:hypothetical protein
VCHKKEWTYAPDLSKPESFGAGYAREDEKYIPLSLEGLLLLENMDVAQKSVIV